MAAARPLESSLLSMFDEDDSEPLPEDRCKEWQSFDQLRGEIATGSHESMMQGAFSTSIGIVSEFNNRITACACSIDVSAVECYSWIRRPLRRVPRVHERTKQPALKK